MKLRVCLRHLVTTNWDQCVRIWDPKTWREVKKLEGHEDNIDALCVVDDMIATGSKVNSIVMPKHPTLSL